MNILKLFINNNNYLSGVYTTNLIHVFESCSFTESLCLPHTNQFNVISNDDIIEWTHHWFIIDVDN